MNETLSVRSAVQQHWQQQQQPGGGQNACRRCPMQFSTRSNQLRHEREVHGAAFELAHTCPVCESQFGSGATLEKHAAACLGPLPGGVSTSSGPGTDEESLDGVFDNASASPVTISQCMPSEAFEEVAGPFLKYLASMPQTAFERTVLHRRLTNPASVETTRHNLRFLCGALIMYGVCRDAGDVSLRLFCNPRVCALLFHMLEKREAGPVRIYHLFLLVSKALLFVCHETRTAMLAAVRQAELDREASTSRPGRRRRLLLPCLAAAAAVAAAVPTLEPQQLASWQYVRNVCEETSREKKCRERALLPHDNAMTLDELAKVARETLSMLESVLTAFTTDQHGDGGSGGALDAADDDDDDDDDDDEKDDDDDDDDERVSNEDATAADAPTDDFSRSSSSLSSSSPSSSFSSSSSFKAPAAPASLELNRRRRMSVAQAMSFSRYLFTASLANLPAPRSQVMRHLQLNKTFVREADGTSAPGAPRGVWRIRYSGTEHSKTGMPLLLVLPARLSALYDAYLEHVRPLLVREAVSRGLPDPQYVYPSTRSLGTRTDFDDWTKSVTMAIIQRPIPPHRFRHSITQAVHDTGADERTMADLADLMQHSPAVQARYYRVPRFERLSRTTNATLQSLYTRTQQKRPRPETPMAGRPPETAVPGGLAKRPRCATVAAASAGVEDGRGSDDEVPPSILDETSPLPENDDLLPGLAADAAPPATMAERANVANRPSSPIEPVKRPPAPRWSQAEERALLSAVQVHGKGRWSSIVRLEPMLSGRTPEQLRNKYRKMQRPLAATSGDAPESATVATADSTVVPEAPTAEAAAEPTLESPAVTAVALGQ